MGNDKRSSWPAGLRFIYWLALFSILLGIPQLFYWIVFGVEYPCRRGFQLYYTSTLLLLIIVMFGLGTLGKRRAFVLFALSISAINIFSTAFFLLQGFRDGIVQFQQFGIGSWLHSFALHIGWNTICIVTSGIIIWYVCHIEIPRWPLAEDKNISLRGTAGSETEIQKTIAN